MPGDLQIEGGFVSCGNRCRLLQQSLLGALTFPLAFAFFVFEIGLVATLQAFIFSTLTAIYLGGAVAAEH